VCNGVAVFDFQRQAWCGTDESSQGCVCVRDWIKFTYGGRTRLGFIGADGWLHLYGEGFEDEVLSTITPYVDVICEPRLLAAYVPATFQINLSDPVPVTGAEDLQAYVAPDGLTIETIADGIRILGADPVVRIGATPPAGPGDLVVTVAAPNGWTAWALLDTVGPQIISPVGIEHYVKTRGYMCLRPYTLQGGAEIKRFICLALQLATWSPSYSVRTIMQGKGTDADQATAEQRDRLKYFDQFDKKDWDPSNANDDFNAPGREDYSWEEDGAGMQLSSGVDVDAHQEFVHRLPVNERGLWMQAEITNTQGRLEILAAAMEAESGEVLAGVAVN
jgi:hypothetical protein